MKILYYFIIIFMIPIFVSGCSTTNSQNSTTNSQNSTINSQNSTINSQNSTINSQSKEYENSTKYFKSISSKELISGNFKKDTFIYFGRESCEYCVEFVPKLASITKEKNIHVYYLDTEPGEKDSDMKSARELYNVEYVPTLIYVKSDGTYNTLDIDNAEDLTTWIEKQVN